MPKAGQRALYFVLAAVLLAFVRALQGGVFEPLRDGPVEGWLRIAAGYFLFLGAIWLSVEILGPWLTRKDGDGRG